jgi:signal transduction histidine kinase
LLPLASGPGPARSGLGGIDARRQLERDLHDGGQNEVVALIIKLTVAEQDPGTPPALAAHARSILDSVRQVARGIYPPMFADSGVVAALRAQAVRASVQ